MWISRPVPDLPNQPKLHQFMGKPSGSDLRDLFAQDQHAEVQGHPHLAAGILVKNSTKHSIYGDDLGAPSLDIPAAPASAVAAVDAFLQKGTPIVPPEPDFRAAVQAAFARKTALLQKDLQRLKRVLSIVHNRTVKIATETAQVDGREVDISDIPPPPLPSSGRYSSEPMAEWLAEIGDRIIRRLD
jgi:hypothetical protein